MSIDNLKVMFDYVNEKKLVLPDFQRDYVWKKTDQKALAASLLLALPIGSFLILEGKKEDFATKEIGFATRIAEPKDECMFLLDGQQRLTSLKIIFSDIFNNSNWKLTINDLYPQLKTRWFLRIIPNDNEDDIFGWNKLKFSVDRVLTSEPSNIEERLCDRNVGKTLSKNWYNPDYRPIDAQGNTIEDIKSNRAFMYLAKIMHKERGLIPLYAIGSTDSSMLLNYAIKEIADRRKDELMAQFKCSWSDTVALLNEVQPLIEDFKDNEQEVSNSWNLLSAKWQTDISNYLNKLLNNAELNPIVLASDKISRAVVIFERINKGGTSLDNFDLVVARAARDRSHESLTKRIINYLATDIVVPPSIKNKLLFDKPTKMNAINIGAVKDNEINNIIKKQYLNLISIISYTEYGEVDTINIDYTKKDKILNLSDSSINNKTEKVILALSRACIFLTTKCGISKVSELHFNLMILPIAYLFLDDVVWESEAMVDKIEYWYWGSIFTGEYRYNQNGKLIEDIRDLYRWVRNGQESERIKKFAERTFNITEYVTKDILIREDIRDIPTSIHKGILQYILSKQPKDILFDKSLNSWELDTDITKDFTFNNKIESVEITVEDHHIIPLKSATSIQESTKQLRDKKNHILNSVLNRTYILKKSNRLIGEDNPQSYLSKIVEVNGFTSSQGHFIDSSFINSINFNYEETEALWKEILGKRFDAIKITLVQELHCLYNSVD